MNYKAFNKIIGHQNAKDELIKALESHNIPHSWLISGPAGIGKYSLIFAFIQELFADIEGASLRINQKTYGDYMEISPEGEKEITIGEIREIGKFLSLTSGEGRYRVLVIDGAEYMNIQASNALLKILEEPPNNSLIFLISHNNAKLLPTIRSRCRVIKMSPLSEEECEMILGVDSDSKIIKTSNGSAGLAMELSKSDSNSLYHNFLNIAALGNLEKLFKLENLSESGENNSNWKIITIIISRIMTNIAKFRSSPEFKRGLSAEESKLLQKISESYDLKEWFRIFDKINTMLYEANLLNFDKKHTLIATFSLLKGST